MDNFLMLWVLKRSIKVYFLSVPLFFSSFAFSSINVCEIEGQKMIKLVCRFCVQILFIVQGMQKKRKQKTSTSGGKFSICFSLLFIFAHFMMY